MINLSKKDIYILILSVLIMIVTTVMSVKLEMDIIALPLVGVILLSLSYLLIKDDSLLLTFIIISGLTLTFMIENIGINSFIKYILDYFIILAFCKNIYYFITKEAKITAVNVVMIIFTIFTIISAFINKTDIKRYTFMFYTDYFRYFIIFMSVCNFDLKQDFIKTYLSKLNIALLLQIPMIVIQYFYYQKYWVPREVRDLRQDYISGIMGGKGTSEWGMIVCIAISIFYILYQRKKCTLKSFVILAVSLVVTLILGESKFAIILMVLILLILTMIKLNIKGVISMILIFLIACFGMSQLGKVYSTFNGFLLNKDFVSEYADLNYAGSNLSRTTSLKVANEQLQESGAHVLFGRGIGNAKVRGTIIGEKNEFLSNNIYEFKMFSISQFLVENGWLGFIMFFSIWFYLLYISIKLMKNGIDENQKIIGNCGIPLILTVIASTFYLMCMVKISFSVLAWFLMGILYRTYNDMKNGKRLNFETVNK